MSFFIQHINQLSLKPESYYTTTTAAQRRSPDAHDKTRAYLISTIDKGISFLLTTFISISIANINRRVDTKY